MSGQPLSLCPHLQPLLDRELAAGNTVRDSGPAPGPAGARLVLLAGPFRTITGSTDPTLTYRLVNDPHWWLAECGCTEHQDLLACAFP